jgi:hypothetical protein
VKVLNWIVLDCAGGTTWEKMAGSPRVVEGKYDRNTVEDGVIGPLRSAAGSELLGRGSELLGRGSVGSACGV